MAGWRSEIRKMLIHPDPQYVVSSVAWVVLMLVFAVLVIVRLLGF